MKRINLVVEEGLKDKWQKFVDTNNDVSTISKLIRMSVENYIDGQGNLFESNKILNSAHNISEKVSLIKAFSQMLMDELQENNKLDIVKTHQKLQQIYQNSINIENVIQSLQDSEKLEKETIDILIVDDNPFSRSIS